MIVEGTNIQNSGQYQMNRDIDRISETRKKVDDPGQGEQPEKQKIQPEELLKQIKALTEDGLYSVRFENDERTDGLVVKVVNRQTDEMIRQVPAEELLEIRAVLDDLRGNIVNTAT